MCGITPYDTTHLGHAATFVWADVAARVLHDAGIEVDVCRNITDVDDDLLAHAREQGISWRSLATAQTYRFEDDVARLGIAKPTFEPRAHDYIDEVIELSAALVELGAAYARDGSVYFRGADVPQRAGVDRAEALRLASERGGRPDDPAKDDPLDAAVWQRSEADEPAWPSPWGQGRPGWHAECSAMALALLGSGIDLHGGGQDLTFPHHAYEAAQAEAATGVSPFTRAWLRAGTVLVNGEKMAKSTGNLVFVHDLLDAWPPEAIRLAIVDRPWHEPWDFSTALLEAAVARLERLRRAAGRPGTDAAALAAVRNALANELDAPQALALAEEAGGQAARTAMAVLGLERISPTSG